MAPIAGVHGPPEALQIGGVLIKSRIIGSFSRQNTVKIPMSAGQHTISREVRHQLAGPGVHRDRGAGVGCDLLTERAQLSLKLGLARLQRGDLLTELRYLRVGTG